MHNLKFYLFLLLFGIFFSSCEKNDPTIIDPSLHYPSVLSVYVTPNTFDTTYLSAIIGATVSSEVAITSVTAKILNPGGVEVTSVQLKDDGVSPDTSAGDMKFTGRLNFVLDCKLIGTYTVQVVAENTEGLRSGPSNATFLMSNLNNHRPFLTDLICPSDLIRPAPGDTTVVFFQVKGNDPDGNCDVKQVQFNSYNPNGFPSSGNPFSMFDDGQILAHGDTVAGDSKYSLLTLLTPNPSDTSIGNFTFKFFAFDQQFSYSDTLTRIINIHR